MGCFHSFPPVGSLSTQVICVQSQRWKIDECSEAHQVRTSPSPRGAEGQGRGGTWPTSHGKLEAELGPLGQPQVWFKSGCPTGPWSDMGPPWSDVGPRPVVGPLAALETILLKRNELSLWTISNIHKGRDKSTMQLYLPIT